jgi:hypothetical protein
VALLSKRILDAPLTTFEEIRARNALHKVINGRVPQANEVKLLRQIFGDDLPVTMTKNWGKIPGLLWDSMKAIKASYDNSAVLRTAIKLAPRHPRAYGRNIVLSTKSFLTEWKAFRDWWGDTAVDVTDAMKADPHYKLARKSGLALTGEGTGMHEEWFSSANFIKRVPFIGRPISASDRAYSTFLSKLRMDLFSERADIGKKLGIDDPEWYKAEAERINTFSGRGDVKALRPAIGVMNKVMFSPRFVMSNFQALNPAWYLRLARSNPMAAREALKDMSAFVASGMSLLVLAKMTGADVNLDWRSPDFGKARWGKLRMDPWGGMQQTARFIAAIGVGVADQAGAEIPNRTKLTGEREIVKPIDTATTFLKSKVSPPIDIALRIAGAKTGPAPEDKAEMAMDMFAPMVITDAMDIYKETGSFGGLPLIPLSLYGMGVQKYDEPRTLTPEQVAAMRESEGAARETYKLHKESQKFTGPREHPEPIEHLKRAKKARSRAEFERDILRALNAGDVQRAYVLSRLAGKERFKFNVRKMAKTVYKEGASP